MHFVKVRQGGLKGGAKVPHSAELLESIMTFYGGVDGFAAMLMKHFWASPSGGQQRGKVLEMISKLVTANADQGGSKIPLALWTEEEGGEGIRRANQRDHRFRDSFRPFQSLIRRASRIAIIVGGRYGYITT